MDKTKKDNVELICNISELSGMFEKRGNIRGFLQKVVAVLAEHMHADVCSIYLYNEKQNVLILEATYGLNEDSIGDVAMSLGEGLTGLALKELRPICEAAGSQHPQFRYFPDTNEDKFEAFLAVPILRGLTRVGVLVLQDRRKDYFDENDTKALRAIASQLAATLENAKLLIELHRHRLTGITSVSNKADLFHGKSASRGIAIGEAAVLGGREEELLYGNDENYKTKPSDFKKAIEQTELQLESLQKQMEEQYSDIAGLIFSTHLLMLRDDEFSGEIERRIINKHQLPNKAIIDVVNNYVHIFSESSNQRLQEKVQDVKDLGHRLLQNLLIEENDEGDYTKQIVIARELLPSELVKIAAQHAEGIILMGKGASAHVAILARSLALPVIFTENSSVMSVPEGTNVIIDANQGNIFINPDEEISSKYIELKEASGVEMAELESSVTPPTKDGVVIQVLANINLLSDIKLASSLKAQGVGLYRSEFPFIIRNSFPSEEEQYRVYKKLFEEMPDSEITLRTLDIGGDKCLSYFSCGTEANPFLGLRAIRFSLKNQQLFIDQLRAMLRAGAGRSVRIMFPLISSVDDFVDARHIVESCLTNLKRQGIPHCETPLLGAMIELPSVIEVISELAAETDFMSIGTNDLVQYLLGVDRTNEEVSNLYVSQHPSVLRALYRIIIAAIQKDCEISVCGEIAADEHMLRFMIGCGLRKISLNPTKIPGVRKVIADIDVDKAEKDVCELLTLGTIREVHKKLGLD